VYVAQSDTYTECIIATGDNYKVLWVIGAAILVQVLLFLCSQGTVLCYLRKARRTLVPAAPAKQITQGKPKTNASAYMFILMY